MFLLLLLLMLLLLLSFALSCCSMHVSFLPAELRKHTLSSTIHSHTPSFLFRFSRIQCQSFINATNFRAIYNILYQAFQHKEKTETKKKRRQKNELFFIYRRLKSIQMQNVNHTMVLVSLFLFSSAYTFTFPFGFGIINLCISIFQCVNSIYMIRGRKIQKIIWKRIWYTHPSTFALRFKKKEQKKIKYRTESKTVINAIYSMLWIESTKISTIGDLSKLQLDWNNIANRLFVWMIPCTLVQLHGETECCVSVLVSQNRFSFWKSKSK